MYGCVRVIILNYRLAKCIEYTQNNTIKLINYMLQNVINFKMGPESNKRRDNMDDTFTRWNLNTLCLKHFTSKYSSRGN